MESVGGGGGDINITQRLRQDDPPWQKTLTVSAELEQLWRPVSQSAAPPSLSHRARQEAGKLRKLSEVSWVCLRSDCIRELSNSALLTLIIIGVVAQTNIQNYIIPLTFQGPAIG